MRQHVPNLDTNLTNNDFLDLIVSCFHSAIFGTVDQNGEPHTNIVDIDFNEDGRLIFATTNQKNFYRNIKGNNRVCLMKNARKSPYFNAGMDRAKLT